MPDVEISRDQRLRRIVLLCPLILIVCVFVGPEWRDPLSLLEGDRDAILHLRIWRVVLGALVGAALSVAGATLQAVLRNPLAEPYVLGLSSGAGLGTAIAVVSGLLSYGVFVQPLVGFVGSMVSLLVVYNLARYGGRTAPHTLILAGVVWGSVCTSLLFFIVSQSSAEGVHAIMWWLLGDLQIVDTTLIKVVMLLIILPLLMLYGFARHLNALTFGEEMAGYIGIEPELTKKMVLVLASLLAAAAVCVSGLIGFVGLVVPHSVRALVGPSHRRLLPAAACLGASFLVVADAIGRTVLYPVEIPVGVFTSLIGGPFFLVLLRKRQKQVWV